MRPRSSDRGEPGSATLYGLFVVELQCGHGLRTVENVKSYSVNPYVQLLQCGHGLRTVENFDQCCVLSEHRNASMRPRSSDRGERCRPSVCQPSGCRFNAATVFGPWRTAGRCTTR